MLSLKCFSFPSIVLPEDVGMGRSDLGMTPLSPARYPPTSATTSSEESSSQRPSVAITRKRSVDLGVGEAGSLPRVRLRWVMTGRGVT